MSVMLGLLRTKIAALVLGPSGVGVIGLLQSFILMSATLAGLGTSTAATRELAASDAKHGAPAFDQVRRALFWSTLLLTVLAITVVWAGRIPIARHILADPSLADEVGWCAWGVGASIIGSAFLAVISGAQRIRDLARVNVYSAVLTTVTAITALAVFGPAGILLFVLALPISTMLVGFAFAARIGKSANSTGQGSLPMRRLFALGIGLMAGQLVAAVAQLGVRSLVGKELGLAELGLFQASLTISIAYLGFVLQAMATDLYPRLSALAGDHARISSAANDQVELTLLIGGPVIIFVLGLAPWLLPLLYSSEFGAAAEILRWQLIGDTLKLAAWPLSYMVMALGRGSVFVALEAIAGGLFFGITAVLITSFGREAAGLAYMAMYAVYLPLAYAVARRLVGFRWSSEAIASLALLCLATFTIGLLATYTQIGAAIAALCIAGALAIRAARRLNIGPFRFMRPR